ncbi:MAG: Violaxanthin de-epoxidase-domain-containing protein [Monoraphidium minutum]|nr:MAG: Violaxanthin de-epoxidase-domain-containing protein [Monoraphidium minutum]
MLAPLPTVPGGAVGPALASDVAKVGTCLLAKCQGALAQCLADGPCLQNLVCLNLCNAAPDETACQIKCGDQYGDAAIDTFNSCALSEQKCVPKRIDEDLFPVPPDSALDPAFDLAAFNGRWFITAGLNPLFDTFDCQEHFFATEPGKLSAQINWRINKPDRDFIERRTIQDFVQDEARPGVLFNHDNEYLHYEDDWYILASQPDKYALIYYRGNNDAWKGYGGAVVYTRDRQLPADIIPELREAAKGAGIKWEDFKVTDNTCGPHPPPPPGLLKEVEAEVVQVEEAAAQQLRSFGRGFTVLEDRLAAELIADEKELERDLREFEQLLEKAERRAVAKVVEEEELVVKGVGNLLQKVKGIFSSGGGAQ